MAGSSPATSGNMTAGAGRSVSYIAFNMAESMVQGSDRLCWYYDSEHQRVKLNTATTSCNSPTTTTYYLNDGVSGLMSEKIDSGSTISTKDYLSVAGLTVGLRTKVGAAAATIAYYVTDHLGSIAATTDEAGLLVCRLSYDPWGKSTASGAGCTAPTRGFTGEESVSNGAIANLVNLNARVYDPVLARFMAADPILANPFDSQNLNGYSYVLNSPLAYTDPTGMAPDRIILKYAPWVADFLHSAWAEELSWYLDNRPTHTLGPISISPTSVSIPDTGPLPKHEPKSAPWRPEIAYIFRSLSYFDATSTLAGFNHYFGLEAVSPYYGYGNSPSDFVNQTGMNGGGFGRAFTTYGGTGHTVPLLHNVAMGGGSYPGIGHNGPPIEEGVASFCARNLRTCVLLAPFLLLSGDTPQLPAPKLDDHHIFPQQFRKFFESRGIDIEQYTVTINQSAHLRGVHGSGLGNLPGGWNGTWQNFIEKNPNATAKDIFQFSGRLMDRFGFSSSQIHPYGK